MAHTAPSLRDRIEKSRQTLYSDLASVRALEAFCVEAAKR